MLRWMLKSAILGIIVHNFTTAKSWSPILPLQPSNHAKLLKPIVEFCVYPPIFLFVNKSKQRILLSSMKVFVEEKKSLWSVRRIFATSKGFIKGNQHRLYTGGKMCQKEFISFFPLQIKILDYLINLSYKEINQKSNFSL